MTGIIDELLSRYEKGQVSRRHVITSLAALFAGSGSVEAQPAAAPVAVRTLNHVSISVADVKRSVDFYRNTFGLTVKSQQGTGNNAVAGGGTDVVVNLAPGPGPEFIGIYKAEPAGHIGHFCLGVQNFDADKTLRTLQERGVKASMRTRGESKEIFLTDPDNVSVQLTDVSYCGGAGPRGNRCNG
jgi:catechol 2,3-dioxygenase-like lactoylglutathione lyase family enzyme